MERRGQNKINIGYVGYARLKSARANWLAWVRVRRASQLTLVSCVIHNVITVTRMSGLVTLVTTAGTGKGAHVPHEDSGCNDVIKSEG